VRLLFVKTACIPKSVFHLHRNLAVKIKMFNVNDNNILLVLIGIHIISNDQARPE
jgi:hypothetical protein